MQLDTSSSDFLEGGTCWTRGLHTTLSGFYKNAVGAGFGAVLVVRERASGGMLAVRKGEREGYEFGGRWSFPGGMVRWSHRDEPFEAACARSMRQRVASEAGFALPRDAVARYLPANPPPTTCYTAKGARRYTVVLAFMVEVAYPVPVRSRDSSIAEARWMTPLEILGAMAPANTVIAARFLWSAMDEPERATVAAAVLAGLADCARWAAEVGLPAPSARELGLISRVSPP